METAEQVHKEIEWLSFFCQLKQITSVPTLLIVAIAVVLQNCCVFQSDEICLGWWELGSFSFLNHPGGRKTDKHKQHLGIVPGMAGSQICLCVALFGGEKENT